MSEVEFHLTGCPASGGGDGNCRCPRKRTRTVFRLDRFELDALWDAANGESQHLPRPVRRRLVKRGFITMAPPFEATPKGLAILTDNAPRSKWEPPRQQGQSEDALFRSKPRNRIGIAALLSATMLIDPPVR